MRKQRTETRTVEVECCDLCGRDVGGFSPRHCCVCNRSGCYQCLAGTPFYSADDDRRAYMDLFMSICKDCEAAGNDVAGVPFLESMRVAVDNCDAELRRLMARWREWAAERRAKV